MKNPNPLMLLRIAQADAYCMATEYIRLPRDRVVYDDALKFERYCKHPVHMLDAGMYTDDTQMSIALAEQLLAGHDFSRLSCANHFVEAFSRDPRDGYSRGFQAILEKSMTGQDLIDKLIPNSTKNGAAMRAVPLGVLPDLSLALIASARQAAVTHDTEQGIVSACAITFLSYWALHSDWPFEEACKCMANLWPQFEFSARWKGPVKDRTAEGGFDVGMNTVNAVCTLLTEQTTLMGILKQVIEWGGDTDSVAAVAWGIASARMKEDVPTFLETDLEPHGYYGAPFLRDLGTRLMEKYGKGEA